jgi:glucose-6-phosphate 1-dehydrogenase
MEPPVAFEAGSIRDEKAKLFRSILPLRPENIVRGQYSRARVSGIDVAGYQDEEDVRATSTTETFVALKLYIDNWRWAGIPIFVRAGKRLPRRITDVSIAFKDVPKRFFEDMECGELPPNVLHLEIQPEEAVKLSILAKIPGPEVEVKPVTMEFSYGHSFMAEPAEAYERLIYDAMVGDHMLFARSDEVERCWQVLQPVLDELPPVRYYSAGTWGPREADALIAPREWLTH